MHNVMAVKERRSRREIFENKRNENERNEIGISYAWLFNYKNKQTKTLYYNIICVKLTKIPLSSAIPDAELNNATTSGRFIFSSRILKCNGVLPFKSCIFFESGYASTNRRTTS
jgi:hypothetical protein